MRDAESRPSFDIEKGLFNKNTLFFNKNHFLFYYLKLETAVFTDFRNYTDFLINLRDLHAKQGCREREESQCSCLSAILTKQTHQFHSPKNFQFQLCVRLNEKVHEKKTKKVLYRGKTERLTLIFYQICHSEARSLCLLEPINFLRFIFLITQLLTALLFIKRTAVRASPRVLINKK